MDQLIQALQSVVGRPSVLSTREELLVYECDGLPQHKHLPRAVVFPDSTDAVVEIMNTLRDFNVPYTPRGAGTGLSGGALALNSGVVIELARMRKILDIDRRQRTARVQTGLVNLHVSRAVAHLGLHYVPDPSSQPTCTIGGNIAENAGGIHCLKYGTTTDHVLSACVVLSDGSVIEVRSGETGMPGYDLLGVFVGSEGTFGIATEATLRLTPLPEAIRTLLAEFATVDDASHAVSAIIAAGVMPAALEMMDREIIRAIEASVFAAGLPPDAGAALLIELDGLNAGIDDEAEKVRSICLNYNARSCRLARDEDERKKLWAARKGAFGAVGRIAPDSMIQDAVVPRSRLPEIMEQSYRIAAKYQLILANVFHAGDGNLHPLICFDSRSPDEVRRVKEAGRELMETCVRAGGSITGEHGVGLDKREYLPLIFSEDDMDTMLRVRSAFDPFALCNPGKIVPLLRGCGEARAVGDPIPLDEAFPPEEKRMPAPVFQTSSGTLIEQLSDILGSEYVEHHSGSPTVFPATTAELSAVMKVAAASNCAVVPVGSGTLSEIGNPTRRDLIVSTARMNQIIEHVPADLIASAQAGVTLRAFNQLLSENGQWLPLHPPGGAHRSLGGIVALGSAGTHHFGYGPPRRFVIGMTVILSDGRVIKMGGKVVKNVAGYDLSKLFTGSIGTLGIISELTFKLRPVPATTFTVAIGGDTASLLSFAALIRDAKLGPVAVELVSKAIAPHIMNSAEHLLLLRFAGSEKTVKYQVEKTLALATSPCEVISDDTNLWEQVASLSNRPDYDFVYRITVPPARLEEVLKMVQQKGSWQSSVESGVVRIFETYAAVDLDETIRLRQEAQIRGGALIVERAPMVLKRQLDSWGDVNEIAPLMKRIKLQLDRESILSPGRI